LAEGGCPLGGGGAVALGGGGMNSGIPFAVGGGAKSERYTKKPIISNTATMMPMATGIGISCFSMALFLL
jgi:hypothetical protein